MLPPNLRPQQCDETPEQAPDTKLWFCETIGPTYVRIVAESGFDSIHLMLNDVDKSLRACAFKVGALDGKLPEWTKASSINDIELWELEKFHHALSLFIEKRRNQVDLGLIQLRNDEDYESEQPKRGGYYNDDLDMDQQSQDFWDNV